MRENQNFFQIYLSEDEAKELPEPLLSVSRIARQRFSNFDYICWTGLMLRDFISTYYPQDVLNAYDKLRPFAYKADLGRYCLIYKYGGWYADVTLKIEKNVLLGNEVDLFFFYDFGEGLPAPGRCSHECQNSFFYAKASHHLLAECIEGVVKNCRDSFYGGSSTSPTGPELFGRKLCQHVPNSRSLHGHFMPLTPFHQQRNLSYVAPSGDIIAQHKSTWHPSKPRGGDLESLGLSGTNNYNDLWRQKAIYL